MKLVYSFFILVSCLALLPSYAQEIHFGDTIRSYNNDRIIINVKAAQVIGGWGIANAVASGVGLSLAKQDDWHYFHATNLVVGVADIGFAGWRMAQAKKQSGRKLDYQEAYDSYKKDKKLFLHGIYADALLSVIGAGMVYSASNNSPVWLTGVGRALALQGVATLAYDNIVFRAHLRYNSHWAQILDELRFTGKTISFNYTFPVHHIND